MNNQYKGYQDLNEPYESPAMQALGEFWDQTRDSMHRNVDLKNQPDAQAKLLHLNKIKNHVDEIDRILRVARF